MVVNLMLIGLAIALDPLPLTAFLVVLPSQRGTIKGASFVFGWLVSLAIVVTITVLATGNNPPGPARPGPSQELLARFRTRIDTHTDQVIIAGSLIIGFWLIANSLYLIISQTAST